MFDDVIRELKHLEKGVQIRIEIPIDDDGYIDRQCPHAECRQEFKVLMNDWKDKVPDEGAYCPICGYYVDSAEWNTQEQQEYIADHARDYLMGELNKAFSQSVRRFNRSQPRNGWITMKMDYKPNRPKVIVPHEVAELMQQKFNCENCGCRYSSIGASFFCPACGHNSVERDFQSAVMSVEKMLDSLEVVRATLIEHQGKDVASDTIRQMLETSLGKLTGSFQRFMEALFNRTAKGKGIRQRPNAFQNLAESSDLWQTAGYKRYEEFLDSQQWYHLNRFFQQRHLLSHCDGIVDQKYIEKTGDTSYKVGQRIVISPDHVLALAKIIKILGDARKRELKHSTQENST